MRISELVDYRLVFRDADEMKAIAEYLSSHDFEVYNYDEIMLSSEIGKWKCFKWNEEEENFNRTSKVIDDCLNIEELPRINYVSKRNRILKPDIDPFGEENWGYTKESVSLDELCVGDRVVISENNEAEYYCKKFIGEIGIVESIHRGLQYPIYVNWGKETGCHFKEELNIAKPVKRILNLEDDPFGEENWGYLSEQVKYGEGQEVELVGIVDGKRLDGLSGKIQGIDLNGACYTNMGAQGKCAKYGYRGKMYYIGYRISWWIPPYNIKSNKVVNRILKPDIYSFGEENWITENNNKEMITDFKIFEKQYNPYIGEYFQVKYWLTGDLVPVKVIKVNPNNTYLVSFDVDGSVAKGAPEMIIKNSDIVAPYKTLRSPVGTGFISTNTNMSIRQVHQVSNDMYL